MTAPHSPADVEAIPDAEVERTLLLRRVAEHAFQPVAGHPDDDECTYRSDGTDATYCGLPEHRHEWTLR